MMQRFFIDRKDIEYGLKVSEMVCFAALRALCFGGSKSWKGSYRDLANESGCGNKDTAQRAVEELIRRGLVKMEDGVFSMTQIETDETQNETDETQNETTLSQIETISKEKRTKKENNINMNNGVCIKESDPHAPTMVYDKNKVFEPPQWNDWEEFAKYKNIPLETYQLAWSYYMMKGWEGVRDWKAALMYWFMKDKQKMRA